MYRDGVDGPPVEPPAILSVVADPHRWRLLAELARGDRRVAELTELIGRPQSVVSYHLAELRNAGVVTARRSSADGRDVYYRADLHRCRDLMAAAAGALHPAVASTAPGAPTGPAEPASERVGPARVLFLCTGNSARSQMAQALLSARTGGAVEARSAGSHPKALHPLAVRVMADRGIDLSGHEPTHLRRFSRSRFDRVITLCDKVREICPRFPGSPLTAHWSIADPAAPIGATGRSTGRSAAAEDADALARFEHVADELETRIALLIAELAARQPERTSHAR